MASLLTVSEVSVIKGMGETERPMYFNVLATVRRTTVDEIVKAYEGLLESAAKRDAVEATKAENARKAALAATLATDIEAFRLGTTAANGDAHDILFLEELRERAEDCGGLLAFLGLGEDGIPRFGLKGLKAASTAVSTGGATGVRGGGTGAGRPSNDAPQPFVCASTGERVKGPVTIWLRKNVTAEALAAASLLKADGKLKASGSVMADLAVKAGILAASPVEEPASEPVAEVSAPVAEPAAPAVAS
jgi:hypothetical protein